MTLDPTGFRFGFRVLGNVFETRWLTIHATALGAALSLDARSELEREQYLSNFTFADDFADYLRSTGSTARFAGPCWSRWLAFDIDREGDLEAATRDARKLAAFVADRWRLEGDELLLFFSGSKGFHLLAPLAAAGSPPPSIDFADTSRRLAEHLSGTVGVKIDRSIYDRQRLFRSPNSRHPKTGLRKRPITFDELLAVKPSAIRERAREPQAVELPPPPRPADQAVADWRQAAEEAASRHATRSKTSGGGEVATAGRLNRATLAFIRDGAAAGERHARLFSAAANLAELGSPLRLALELLAEPALDCGLSPADARRTITNGHEHGGKQTP